jgi:hypothetical protein
VNLILYSIDWCRFSRSSSGDVRPIHGSMLSADNSSAPPGGLSASTSPPTVVVSRSLTPSTTIALAVPSLPLPQRPGTTNAVSIDGCGKLNVTISGVNACRSNLRLLRHAVDSAAGNYLLATRSTSNSSLRFSTRRSTIFAMLIYLLVLNGTSA